MSGGHFDYKQYYIGFISNEILKIIQNNNVKDEYGYSTGFSDEVLEKLHHASLYLKRGIYMAEAIDRLVSGDTSEESFLEEWNAI